MRRWFQLKKILRSWASTPDYRAYEGSTRPVSRLSCCGNCCGEARWATLAVARSQKCPACQRRAPRPCIPGLACASMLAGITLCRNDRSTVAVVAPEPQAQCRILPLPCPFAFLAWAHVPTSVADLIKHCMCDSSLFLPLLQLNLAVGFGVVLSHWQSRRMGVAQHYCAVLWYSTPKAV